MNTSGVLWPSQDAYDIAVAPGSFSYCLNDYCTYLTEVVILILVHCPGRVYVATVA